MIRKFALVVIDSFDKEIDRFNLDYADAPKNLGFELEYTTIETRLTSVFTSAKEKKIPTTVNINFLPPYAYNKANAFRQFIQRHIDDRIIFEYNDTTSVKNWEGKVQKFELTELADWGGLSCPMSFIPATPKFIKKDNVVQIKQSSYGKSYSFEYPYSYGESLSENNSILNDYFDEIPLRVVLYGKMTNPQVSLLDVSSGEVYSTVRLDGLTIEEEQHLVIDAINSKILLYRNGSYFSAYEHVGKQETLDSFLFARKHTTTELIINLDPGETGYLVASYRKYVL